MARQALKEHHYNPKLPHGRTAWLGVWFGGEFYGCVIFGNGAGTLRGKKWGLNDAQVTEVTRIALRRGHPFTVSRVLSVVTKVFIPQKYPKTELLLSYADVGQGHHGGIYQAAGWCYLGVVRKSYFQVGGQLVHPMTLYNRFGAGGQSLQWLRKHVDPAALRVPQPEKHRYAKGISGRLQRDLAQHCLPYPRPVLAKRRLAG